MEILLKKDFESRIGPVEDVHEISIFSYFTYCEDDTDPHGEITVHHTFEYGEESFLYKTSIEELVTDFIDGSSCCTGNGLMYGLAAAVAQDIALEMLKQASRLLDNCCYLEPSEEDHLRHRGELNADIYRNRVSED